MTSKYGNKRTVVDGYRFDSLAEARRYQELRLMERAGEIRDLRVHTHWPLHHQPIFGEASKLASYEADFDYWHVAKLQRVVEDVKSEPTKTPMYRLKKKWLKLEYGIEIQEIEA